MTIYKLHKSYISPGKGRFHDPVDVFYTYEEAYNEMRIDAPKHFHNKSPDIPEFYYIIKSDMKMIDKAIKIEDTDDIRYFIYDKSESSYTEISREQFK